MKYTTNIYFKNSKICKISYSDNDIDMFEYVFEPIYEAIDNLKDSSFRGIQGLDLTLRLPKYIRQNQQPVFIFEHNFIRGKKNFRALQRVGEITLLEYLSKNSLEYFGDKLIIKE